MGLDKAMSLLWMEHEKKFQELVECAFSCEKEGRPEYFSKLSKRIQKIIYRDTKYNVDFLYTAFVLNDEKIMENYALWLFRLMASVFEGKRTLSETADYVIEHFEYICQGVKKTIDKERQPRLFELLDCAKKSVDKARGKEKVTEPVWRASDYEKEINQYMQALLKKDSRRASYLIQQFNEAGIPTQDIYAGILAESMRRVGELWHTAKISVDEEHYCTSVTQMAMAQMYPNILLSERKDKTLLCACPGTELHEMGARMVADIFENDGWDSIYLGAAVPEDAMLSAIRENQPDLVVLSVTMPPHLLMCRELVGAIKEEFPDCKLAVGGNAFRATEHLWSQWPIDAHTEDARELLAWANGEINV